MMRLAQEGVTAEDLLALGTEHGRFELIGGVLYEMPPNSFDHGGTELSAALPLKLYLRRNPIGRLVGGEVGFVLARRPDIVRAPDLAFVRRERLPVDGSTFFDGPPDLAMEVLSPSDRASAVGRKVTMWLEYGTREVWVLDPRTRTVTVHRPGEEATDLGETDDLDGGDVLSGFRIAVAELFE
jgi:Uma2 family endonuclease